MPFSDASKPTILIAGASRGLGHAMAAEFIKRGWNVIGTVRAGKRTPLHDLADANAGRLEIETLDIRDAGQIAALKDRLSGRTLDMLFVNAGIGGQPPMQTIAQTSTDEFTELMITNALSPLRVIESLEPLVAPNGLIGAMSSGLGSVANNEMGQFELYRGTKAALNMFMRSFAVRQAKTSRALAVMAPGWVRTDMGGPAAPLGIEDSIPKLVDVLIAKQGRPGIEYLDYQGKTVPW